MAIHTATDKDRKVLSNNAVDCVIFGFNSDEINLLLIQRTDHIIQDSWALPGALIYEDESLDQAAARILFNMSGVSDIYLDQVKSFGQLDRVPGRIISTVYYALVDVSRHELHPRQDGQIKDAKWFKVTELPPLPMIMGKWPLRHCWSSNASFDTNPLVMSCYPRSLPCGSSSSFMSLSMK
ncbi:MAG: NUDIX hydrolase [Cytophagales bacterium]|nr:NUDIX hydrolase [Cytophagales bacterium]